MCFVASADGDVGVPREEWREGDCGAAKALKAEMKSDEAGTGGRGG